MKTRSRETNALGTLVRGLVDYAGLFPPAQLDMGAAVAEYARERQGDDAWMLARFIVPVGRLTEFADAARDRLPRTGDPWPLSVLAGEADRPRIDAFDVRGAVIEAVELKAATVEDVRRQAGVFAGLEIYFEIPHRDDPSALLAALAEHGARAKIRTGGVTADAIPSAAEVARFLFAAARAGVAFKATAGLHHLLRGEYPLTYEPDSAAAVMHGYLNVFLAAAFARRGDLDEPEIVTLLEERDAAAFAVDGSGVRWRGHEIAAEDLAAARREFATSYGSCSFREPVDELRQLRRV